MKDLSKVLIITDMDGTLLPSDKKLNKKDLAAIESFRKCGGHFSIATGRSIQSASQYFDELKLTEPVIVCNGGGIFDCGKGNFTWEKFVEETAYDVVNEIFEHFPHIGGEVSLSNEILVPKMSAKEQYHLDISYGDKFRRAEMKDIPTGGWCKFLFAAESGEIDELVRYVSENVKENLTFVRSSMNFFEILPNSCSKGSALKKLTELYSMDDWTVVACGDFDNDLEMIKFADIGFAPSNAQDCVKEAADFISDADCSSGFMSEVINHVMNVL